MERDPSRARTIATHENGQPHASLRRRARFGRQRMQFQDAGQRVEFRVLVDQRGVEPLRRRRHERIREGKLVRRLQPRRLAAERPVRLVPPHGLVFHGFEKLTGLVRSKFLRRDVFQFRERNKRGMERRLSVHRLLKTCLHFISPRFVLRPA